MSANYNLKELNKDKLLYEWEVSVDAAPIISQLEEELKKRQEDFEMAGYRKGHVPMQMVRKHEGGPVLSHLIETQVDQTLRAIFDDKGIRPALQPVVEIKTFSEKDGLVFRAKVEYIENVPAVDWSSIEVDVIKVEVMQEDIDKALDEVKKKFKMYKDADHAYAAKTGDAVLIDFKGKINDKSFVGGDAEDVRLELGSGQFIPGFEDQLIGAKSGTKLVVRAMFPKSYNNKDVAGKAAMFDVSVKKVMIPESVKQVDDAFAAELGVESVQKLLEMVKEKISTDMNSIARLKLKKTLFDKVDGVYKFEVPAGMIKLDFDSMWNEMQDQKRANPSAFKGKSEESLRSEYMEIAKRRVRLGIILAEIAKENNIEVTEDDLRNAMFAEAMMKPGQESMVFSYYSKPENLELLKGPILEEKAVDYILSKVKTNEISVNSKEFFEKYAADITTQPRDV